MSRTITIQRPFHLSGAAVPQIIEIDGSPVDTVKTTETKTITIDNGAHILTIRSRADVPDSVKIPAGEESYVFKVNVKIGMLRSELQLVQVSVTAPPRRAAQPQAAYGGDRNWLDNFRPGGSQYTPLDTNKKVDSLQELEEALIATGTALYMRGYLDPSTPQNRGYAEQSEELFGAPMRNIRIRLTFQQGKFVIYEGYYSTVDYVPGTEFHTDSSERGFDMLVSTISKNQIPACSVPEHDLGRIYNMTLTMFAEEYPRGWMAADGWIYNQKPR